MDYENYTGAANLLVNPDGSLQTFSGIAVDMATVHEKYKRYLPQANKYLNPDGSIATLSSILGIVDGIVPQDVVDAINSNSAKAVAQQEQIQNCFVELGTPEHPLVGGFSVKDGMMHKIQIDAPISQGNGTIFDPNGMQGVIDYEDESIYIGEGYENIYKFGENMNSNQSSIFAIVSRNVYIEDGWNVFEYTMKNINQPVGDTSSAPFYSATMFETTKLSGSYICEPYPGYENLFDLTGVGDMYDVINYEGNKIELYRDSTARHFPIQLPIVYQAQGQDVLYKWRAKEIVQTKTSNILPFVPNTAPNGRLVMDEPWTTETHSFIGIGFSGAQTTGIFARAGNDLNTGSVENYRAISSVGYTGDLIISNTFDKYIREDGNEYSIEVRNRGLSDGKFTIGFDNNSVREAFHVNFTIWLTYKGDLGEEGLRNEYAKIKLGKYIIPQKLIGTPHNVPYFQKKADDNGVTYTTTKVDENRDTFLANRYGFYEFIPKNTGIPVYGYVEEINDVWAIPSFFTNVSGVLRVTEEGQIRKVR
ncbi:MULTISPECIES: hypothetical protein [Psychrilyobacter]|uniref:Uncharacterized protein n=1 Tax=Psychrilyobacter piezotolerans TaxID=2293438 RepID=A0ABX9KIM8_9FUSO|nr:MULTISPECIES: hypothetical protein [Psychrilyobacter]MCS5420781.1 hypothetical protein [Psychrilyobacter sp. S5]NDI77425.1 hypothetical protein [Psychrilyobacter piezotolerans]RDE63728.1 hypothetical protein DV867_04960 [Psychrilyobacter sp. S5]REI42072.1 hypothetical protein DYH56_04960 [Psychrilyobacter piezotolerans]